MSNHISPFHRAAQVGLPNFTALLEFYNYDDTENFPVILCIATTLFNVYITKIAIDTGHPVPTLHKWLNRKEMPDRPTRVQIISYLVRELTKQIPPEPIPF